MSQTIKIMDGNEAAAYVAYAFTEVAGIYPITPSSPMAEKTDEWSAAGRENIFGQTVQLVEMQSEAGAVGVMHGALEAGALATSYTSSQGLMLMIPTMHRISGQRHPGVLHVAARTVGTHAFSIFGDHSDVMNCRQTGFAMLSTGGVQEVMDLGGVAHLSAIKGRIPFMHFFDGFRTSHEIQKIECIDYKYFSKLLDWDALEAFRSNSLNPEHPVLRSSVQNPDIYFQVRESNNKFYDALPGIVQGYMDEINQITGKEYKLFNYYGAPDAESIIIAMGSVSGTIQETIDYLLSLGAKVGFVQIHLYRPFSIKHFMDAIPTTVTRIAVLDRLKEIGAIGEPLYEDICTAYMNVKNTPEIYAGRYGLSSKDTTPAQIKAVFDNLEASSPKNHFTIGIEDDVTGLSLKIGPDLFVGSKGTLSCKFWGLGSDGTVGANKNSIKIIGENTDMYTQAYFEYDTKKSFGVTKSHLRFGKLPIRSSYLVKRADFIACHNQSYLNKYSIISELKENGTFLLNCEWDPSDLNDYLPAHVKSYIAEHHINFYIINANKISQELGLGNRSNMVLQSAFFKLAEIIPVEDAAKHMKAAVRKTYGKKGDNIVRMNLDAIDRGVDSVVKVRVPAEWKICDTEASVSKDVPEFIKNILIPINAQEGDGLPVSAFEGMEDGTLPLGTSAYEKRGIATSLPVWIPEYCLQCNQCSFVCPHSVLRPYLLNEQEAQSAPNGFVKYKAKGTGLENYHYSLQISSEDCSSCGSCAAVCPAKQKALAMTLASEVDTDLKHWKYGLKIQQKNELFNAFSVKGSQFIKPLLEFSGACAGCGETPYVKLLTQLYGDKMYLANATGCTQAWGSAMPCIPYTTTQEGKGPAWSNSLFENNAEFSLGMCFAVKQQREAVRESANKLLDLQIDKKGTLAVALSDWLESFSDLDASQKTSGQLVSFLEKEDFNGSEQDLVGKILRQKDQLAKKSMWMVGGDGWAYDIGYGGLDHVFSLGLDVNVLVLDTEVYSNTGGQASKATQIGAVAQFAASGKKSRKKDLGMLMMKYKDVYVAQVAMGADQNQLVKALAEAEKYPGPSIVIAYAPCITHGIKAGMQAVQKEMKDAVESGYWYLYRYNPLNENNPFTLDSKRPVKDYKEFLQGEIRFAALERTFPENAEKLFVEAERGSKEKYENYLKRSESNGE